ncbi:V-type ATP synthase subunit F [Oscillospiraceae bacterium MB08-C2-2]|nr:V-type ATP synthase subunit F [Oscillospiraceae bacterium MB08-C2-2]
MKFFLISDNTDTLIGMRMAGIDGVMVHTAEETLDALAAARRDNTVAVILITAKLMSLCRAEIYKIKLSTSRPLIVEVADRHGDGAIADSITKYVAEAVGIKI